MKLNGLIDIDFVNYKEPCLYISMPYCSFKCNKDCGREVCQNYKMSNGSLIQYDVEDLIDRYISTPLSRAVVFSGLEPFDSLKDLEEFTQKFRTWSEDPIIIYSGYTEEELEEEIEFFKNYTNIIIKFGRFIPDQEPHFDPILGVDLASPNQYAKAYNFKENENGN